MKTKPTLAFIITLLLCATGSAQNFPFTREVKKEMADSDRIFLQEHIKYLFLPDISFTYSINSSDITVKKNKTTPAEPASFKTIAKLEKQLAGQTMPLEKAQTHLTIGQTYKRLNRRQLATQSFDSSLALLKPLLAAMPFDSAVLLTTANIYMSAGNYNEALNYFYRFRDINKHCDELASTFIPLLYLNTGRINEAAQYLDTSLKKWPEGEVGLYYQLIIQVYSFMYLAPQRKEFIQSERYAAMPPDSLFDLSLLYNLHKKYPDDLKWEQFYKGALLLALYMKHAVLDRKDGEMKEIITLNGKDKELESSIRNDFERIQKDRRNKNPYLTYKTLGAIELISKNYKKSEKWFEKALKERKLKESNVDVNAAEIYDNLIALHLLAADTAAAEKMLLKKIKAQPAIDPQAADYVMLAQFGWAKGDMEAAKTSYEKAIGIDSANTKAFVGLAAYELQKGNAKDPALVLNNIISNNASDQTPYLLYGIASLLLKDYSKAYILFKTAYANGASIGFITTVMERFYEQEEN